jgi:hypothetical protein
MTGETKLRFRNFFFFYYSKQDGTFLYKSIHCPARETIFNPLRRNMRPRFLVPHLKELYILEKIIKEDETVF